MVWNYDSQEQKKRRNLQGKCIQWNVYVPALRMVKTQGSRTRPLLCTCLKVSGWSASAVTIPPPKFMRTDTSTATVKENLELHHGLSGNHFSFVAKVRQSGSHNMYLHADRATQRVMTFLAACFMVVSCSSYSPAWRSNCSQSWHRQHQFLRISNMIMPVKTVSHPQTCHHTQ